MFWVIRKAFLILGSIFYYGFRYSLKNSEKVQRKVLKRVIYSFNNSTYGKGIGKIHSLSDFKDKIPIHSYDFLHHKILESKNSGMPFLSPYKTIFFEQTSGSSGARKLIPYNKKTIKIFGSLFILWCYDIFKMLPHLEWGKSFISTSPHFTPKEIEGNVGTDSDLDYIHPILAFFLSPFVIPKNRQFHLKAKGPEEFKFLLGVTLISETRLEIISVWNPTYLLNTLVAIQNEKSKFLDIAKKVHPKMFDLKNCQYLENEKGKIDWEIALPSLKFISSWGDSHSSESFRQLKIYFPSICIQEKGLLATEGPFTFPLFGLSAPIPLINELFFEFQDRKGDIFNLWDLKVESQYSLIISHPGGLYRYPMGDQVQVVGKEGNTPLLKFLGRNNFCSDLVGEKLHESFIKSYPPLKDGSVDFVVIPIMQSNEYFYKVIGDFGERGTIEIDLFEQFLSKNPHYYNSRKIGQLGPLEYCFKEEIKEKVFQFFCHVKGLTPGQVKQRYLFDLAQGEELLNYLGE